MDEILVNVKTLLINLFCTLKSVLWYKTILTILTIAYYASQMKTMLADTTVVKMNR